MKKRQFIVKSVARLLFLSITGIGLYRTGSEMSEGERLLWEALANEAAVYIVGLASLGLEWVLLHTKVGERLGLKAPKP